MTKTNVNLQKKINGYYWHYNPTKQVTDVIGSNRIMSRSLGTGSVREAAKRRDIIQGLIYLLTEDFDPIKAVPELKSLVPELMCKLENYSNGLTTAQGKKVQQFTVCDLRDMWIERVEFKMKTASDKEKKNLNSHISAMKKALERFFAANGRVRDLPIKSITKSNVAAFRDHCFFEKNLSKQTFSTYCIAFNRLWTIASERDIVHRESPFRNVDLSFAKKEAKRKPFTPEQMVIISSMFAKDVKSHRDYEDWIATNIFLTTGARRDEVFNIKRSDINITENGMYCVIGENGKTENAKRVVPIHPYLGCHIKELIKFLAKDDLIFLDARRRIKNDSVYVRSRLGDAYGKRFKFKLDKESIGTKELVLHCSRHTLGTALDHADIDSRTAAMIAGHSGNDIKDTPMILTRYSTGKTGKQLIEAMVKTWDTDLMKPLIKELGKYSDMNFCA